MWSSLNAGYAHVPLNTTRSRKCDSPSRTHYDNKAQGPTGVTTRSGQSKRGKSANCPAIVQHRVEVLDSVPTRMMMSGMTNLYETRHLCPLRSADKHARVFQAVQSHLA